MISATVSGTVAKDAELRSPRGGEQVLCFSVASRRFANGQEQTDWVSISMWGKRAVAIALHVTKGSRIAARGALHVREYESNGTKRFSLELRADDVELLGSRTDAAPQAASSNAGGRSPKAGNRDDFNYPEAADGIPF